MSKRHFPDLLAIGLVFLAYTITVWAALGLSFGAALVGGAANTVPVVIFGAFARLPLQPLTEPVGTATTSR